MEIILIFILILCMIGLCFYIAGRAFSKNMKVFNLSFGKMALLNYIVSSTRNKFLHHQ